eukprot:1487943-Alexandrium_andersonii.AAC.1
MHLPILHKVLVYPCSCAGGWRLHGGRHTRPSHRPRVALATVSHSSDFPARPKLEHIQSLLAGRRHWQRED